MSERCEKCGGTDILVRYFAKGQMLDRHQKASDARWKDLPDNVGEDVYRLTATEPLLRKRCRTCQWWWTEEPGAAPEPTAEPEGEGDRWEAMTDEMEALRERLYHDRLDPGGTTTICKVCDHAVFLNGHADDCPVTEIEEVLLTTRPPSEALREAFMAGWTARYYREHVPTVDRDEAFDRWLARTDATEAHRQPQDADTGLNAILGRWPGDETDEEVRAAMEGRTCRWTVQESYWVSECNGAADRAPSSRWTHCPYCGGELVTE